MFHYIKKYCFFLSFCVFLFHCGKRSNRRLGVDYYKMSMFELEEGGATLCSYRRALRHVDKALEQEVRPHYMAHRATLLFLLGKEKESCRCFKRALALPVPAGIRTEILNNYACLLAKRGKQDKALKIFRKLEQDKNYITPEVALVNQAKIYYESGDYDFAKSKLVFATRISPGYVDAHYYLGLVFYALKDYGCAIDEVNLTLKLEPAHLGARELLGILNN